MNEQLNWLLSDKSSVVETAEKIFNLNREMIEKYWSQQMAMANITMTRGLAQMQRLSQTRSVEDFIQIQNEFLEESAKQGLENARQVIEMFNATSGAFREILSLNGATEAAESSEKPVPVKKRRTRKKAAA